MNRIVYVYISEVSQMFTCGLSDLLSCGRFVGCFCIARIPVSSVSCRVYIDQLPFLSKLVIFFFIKAYYQESYILIIKFTNVVNLAERYNGSFESQTRL